MSGRIKVWPQELLALIEALRPELLPLAEAIAYEGRSPRWVRRKFGRGKWEDLREFVLRHCSWTRSEE